MKRWRSTVSTALLTGVLIGGLGAFPPIAPAALASRPQPPAGLPAQNVARPAPTTPRGAAGFSSACGAPPPCGNLTYHQGWVMHATKTFAIYWKPSNVPSNFMSANYQTLINRYLGDLGNTSAYDLVTQYSDTTTGALLNSSSLGGTFADTTPTASGHTGTTASPVTDADVQAEVAHAISVMGGAWQPSPYNAEQDFFAVFLPQNVDECAGTSCRSNAFCAYHSWFADPSTQGTNFAVYASMPYDGSNFPSAGCTTNLATGTSATPNGDLATDSEISTLSHELFESATNPLPGATCGGVACDGWYFNNGSHEIGDECNFVFGTLAADGGNETLHGDRYITQQEWSNGDSGCVTTFPDHLTLAPGAGAATSGASFGVSATAADSGANTAPGYIGRVHFTSTDPAATLPADYVYTAGDAGVHGFNVVLRTTGTQTVTATDVDTASIAGAFTRTVAASTAGEVAGTGSNGSGQLCNATTTNAVAPGPAAAPLAAGVVATASGVGHTLALRNDGTVWACGSDGHGQLGTGGGPDSSTPTTVPGLSGITAIAADEYHSLALRSDGTVWAWGNNTFGQLGDGTTTERVTPTMVTGLPSTVVAVSAGWAFDLALTNTGAVYAWGVDAYGELGVAPSSVGACPWAFGTRPCSLVPVLVPGVTASAISAGWDHALAVVGGQVVAWGLDNYGQLGNGLTTISPEPPQAPLLSNVVAVSAGGSHSLALRSDGTVQAWGNNRSGQLGIGSQTAQASPVAVGVANVTSIAAGPYDSLAVEGEGSDESAMAWGSNVTGQLGVGDTAMRTSPAGVAAVAGSEVSGVSAGSSQSLFLLSSATTTTLVASPASPQPSGTTVLLTARVVPAAAGSVQFADGGFDLGAPVAVSAGTATMSTAILAVGTHSLSAVFTPADEDAGPSTSIPVAYAVTP